MATVPPNAEAGIPKTHWRGIPLPQFDIPTWRKRAGVPRVVLKPVSFDGRFIPTNHLDPGPEDVEPDSQSDHSVSEDSDAPASNLDPDENENEEEHEDEHLNPNEQEDERPTTTEREDERELYEDVDVTGLEIEGLSTDPNKNDWNFEKWTEHLTKFVRSPFGPEGFLGGGWHGVKPLGRGGFGMAGLWERQNEDNTTVDVRPPAHGIDESRY